jgi:hypothetical protein
MSEPVVVDLDEMPAWYLNCVASIYSTELGYWQQLDVIRQWFLSRYGADYVRPYHLTFPSREKYLECLLTWS